MFSNHLIKIESFTHNRYFAFMFRAFDSLSGRLQLDRRRLEDAHFQYAILRVASWYNFDLASLPLHGSTQETILCVVNSYHEAFMKKYSCK